MLIESITLHRINMPLRTPFTASYGTYTERESIIVEMTDRTGHTGWGECVAFATPWYTEETIDTAWHVLQDFLIPTLLDPDQNGEQISHPSELSARFQLVKRHHMAKASLEMAAWDLYAKINRIPLAQAIGGNKKEVEAGVAIGLQKSETALFQLIQTYIEQGYNRIKVKIKPGTDIDLIRGIRNQFPDIALMADANSAYTLQHSDHLAQLDDFGLLMIEQPLADDDIIDHAKLQAQLATPLCLDESIVSYESARQAIELDSCRIINLKIGRVGGISEAKRIHDLCVAHHVPVWCGGMLETGIGRAHSIALASLPGFTLPGDLSPSARYWERDIVSPEITVKHGKITVPTTPGIGFAVDREYLQAVTIDTSHHRR